ncbi:MAG: IS110 family transposase [Dermatophilaceae bacterium]
MKVFIGVDPHKLSVTIEAVDKQERVLATGRFATDNAGYRAMRKHVASWPERVWAVEGSNGVGRSLAQRLLADGEHVVDVPAKLSARARLLDTGHNRKTDAHDAHSVAVVAVRTKTLRVLSYDAELEALRMLSDRREELGRARVQTVNRLHRLLAELTPGKAKKDITTGQAKAILASVRPRDVVGKTRRRLAAEQLSELVVIEKKTKEINKELKAMVLARGSTLMDLPGVGPVVAARVLADTGDVARFADRNRFASWTGTAPLDASSGEQNRHRLCRAGNRRMNHMIHIAAVNPAPPRHRRAGLLPPQARRGKEAAGSAALPQTPDLRRPLSTTPRRRPSRRHRQCRGRRGGPGRAPRGVSDIQRGRLTPAHRHFGSATSRTREHDATPDHFAEEDPRRQNPPNHLLGVRGVPV